MDEVKEVTPRVLTQEEYNYLWYIEYGYPFHYITPPPAIGATIKKLLEDGIVIQLPNPTLEKSPLYTRFTKEGRMLFLAHEWILDFKHTTELADGEYEYLMKFYDIGAMVASLKFKLR